MSRHSHGQACTIVLDELFKPYYVVRSQAKSVDTWFMPFTYCNDFTPMIYSPITVFLPTNAFSVVWQLALLRHTRGSSGSRFGEVMDRMQNNERHARRAAPKKIEAATGRRRPQLSSPSSQISQLQVTTLLPLLTDD